MKVFILLFCLFVISSCATIENPTKSDLLLKDKIGLNTVDKLATKLKRQTILNNGFGGGSSIVNNNIAGFGDSSIINNNVGGFGGGSIINNNHGGGFGGAIINNNN